MREVRDDVPKEVMQDLSLKNEWRGQEPFIRWTQGQGLCVQWGQGQKGSQCGTDIQARAWFQIQMER